MEEAPPHCNSCPVFNASCFQAIDTIVPYDYGTIYLKYPQAQAGEVMSSTIMPQSVFDSLGAVPTQFNFLTSTGTGTLWRGFGNNLGVYAFTENTGVPKGVITPIVLPTGTSFVDVYVIGYGGLPNQTPPAYFTTTGQIFYIAENGTYGSGAVVYFPRLPIASFSLLLQNNSVFFYINDVGVVSTSMSSISPTNGVAIPPNTLTPGTGGGGGTFSLINADQYAYLASNGFQGKDGRVLNVPLNTPESTQVVSNLITGNLTNIQFNSSAGVTNLSQVGNSGVTNYSFPTSAGIQYTQTLNPGGVIMRCYAY
jgi:hypothetical protein